MTGRPGPRARSLLSLLTVAALLLCAADARAYCLLLVNKSPVKWKTAPVVYSVSSNVTDAKVLAAIDAAMKTWTSVACADLTAKKGASFPICTDAACASFKKPKDIQVFWFTKTHPMFANAANPKVPYLSSAYYFHDGKGGLTGYAIAINAADYKWDTNGGSASKAIFDVQNEMTAKLGEALGLEASKVKTASLHDKYSYGDTSKRALDTDDIQGITYLYLKSGCTSPPAPDATGCSKTAPAPDGGPPASDGPVPQTDTGPAGDGPVTAADQGGTTADQGGTAADQGGTTADQGGAKQCTSSTQCPSGQVCTAEGKCVSTGGTCSASSDCGEGEVCTKEGKCVSTGGDDGCAVASGAPAAGWPAALLVLALLLCARRRRTA